MSARELRLSAPLSPAVVEELVRTAAASGRMAPLCLTVQADARHVRVFVSGEPALLARLGSSWLALSPGSELQAAELPEFVCSATVRLRTRGSLPLFRDDAAELASDALFGALRPLGKDEHVRVVARLWPTQSRRNLPDQAPGGQLTKLRGKYRDERLVAVEIIVGTTSQHEGRAVSVLGRVAAPLRARQGSQGALLTAHARGARAQRWIDRPLPWWTPARRIPVSPNEGPGLLPLPQGTAAVPGLSFEVSPRRPLPGGLPATGRSWGTSTWDSTHLHSVAQPWSGVALHTLISGPTGSGKSVLLTHLVRQAMAAGRGCLVLDVKGDLASDVLAQIPASRRDDVLVIDPAGGLPQPGIRVFGQHSDPDLTADLLVGTLRESFPDAFGIRTASYLRLAAQTLARVPGSTLLDLPLLFSSPAWRRRIIGGLGQPLLQAAWARFDGLSAAEQATHLAPLLTRLDELVTRPAIRVVLGQSSPKLSFSEVLARGRIVIVRVPRGVLGEASSRLLASLVLWQAFQATLARAALPPDRRPLFELFLDEAGALGRLPLPLDALLEQARGFGVGATIAPQSLAQLPSSLRAALAQNAGTVAAFRQPDPAEAKALAALLPGVSDRELQSLGRHELLVRLGIGPGVVSAVTSVRSDPPAEPQSDPRELAAYAASRWGASLADVDEAFASRLGRTPQAPAGAGAPQGPPGARRRAP